jgi:acyl carrier protein
MTADLAVLAERVADLWQQALGLEALTPDDDFFELGGNSISAIRLLPLISQQFQIELDALFVFDHPTPKEFAAALGPLLPSASPGTGAD